MTSKTHWPKTLYVIHHSHTDIGYTEMQGRIERWHVDFIRQALQIIESSRSQIDENFTGFKWVCETFWAVERFIDQAKPREVERLIYAITTGDLGLSASYLNFTELIDRHLLDRMTARAVAFGASIGIPVDCALTADINGFGWGFSQTLHDNGVKNLFCCVHTHHGMYPLGRQQIPFWWETPQGDRILVWSGEHYHFGNELGIVPGAVSSYLTKDECDADMIFSDHWGVATLRIPRYFERLEGEGYPYDFVPVMASGLRTDNAPPSKKIIDFIRRWNTENGMDYRIEIVTLGEFFNRLRAESDVLPVYRGDWPDWWSDGAASNPAATTMFRQAQRDLHYYEELTRRYPNLRVADTDEAEYDLALYAEHTFSHSDAMSQPWHALVHGISARKRSFAATGREKIESAIDAALGQLGATPLIAGMPLRYKIINPIERAASGIARLPVYHFEYHELGLDKGAVIVDTSTGTVLPGQITAVPRGAEYIVFVDLPAGAERVVEVKPSPGAAMSLPVNANNTDNAATAESEDIQPRALETTFAKISWENPTGITHWIDKTTETDLIDRDHPDTPFAPVYEITPVANRNDICGVRGNMGLNRKGPDVRCLAGRLIRAREVHAGPVLSTATLDFDVEGTGFYSVTLNAYQNEPRVDVTVRIHKLSVWEPENLFVALPFSPGSAGFERWLDKAGAMIRPGIDQIPGSLTDYYSVQEGAALCSGTCGVVIATPDTHLIQLGKLDYGPRPLAGDADLASRHFEMYVWLMNNFWETNFEAELGGFYEFRFSVLWGADFRDPVHALERCRDTNYGIRSFRLKNTGDDT
jgi:hypothetical protein